MDKDEVIYGIETPVDKGDPFQVYKVTNNASGVWVVYIGAFVKFDDAAAFVRAWNGQDVPVQMDD